jgi:hypothetical protein
MKTSLSYQTVSLKRLLVLTSQFFFSGFLVAVIRSPFSRILRTEGPTDIFTVRRVDAEDNTSSDEDMEIE